MDEISIVIGLVGAALAVATFFIGRVTSSKRDGEQTGQIMSELGFVKCNTEEIKRRLDKQEERDREYMARLVAVEESAKQAHKRIDGLKNDSERNKD